MLLPSLHPVFSILPHPLYPKRIELAEVSALARHIKENGQYQPIDLVEVNGQLYCFNGVMVLLACKEAGMETVSGRIHVITEEEVLDRMGANLFLSKGATLFDKYRMIKTMQNKLGITKNCDLAKRLGISPAQVTKILALDNLRPEIRNKAEELKKGSEFCYYLANVPPEQQGKELDTPQKCKVFTASLSTAREKPVTRKMVRADKAVYTAPDKSKVVLEVLKSFDADSVSVFLRDLAEAIERLKQVFASPKELLQAALVELQIKRGSNNG